MATIVIKVPLIDLEYFEVADAVGEKLHLGRRADRFEVEAYTRELLDKLVPEKSEKNEATGHRRGKVHEGTKSIKQESAPAGS